MSVVSVAPAGDAGIRWTSNAGRHEVLYEAVDSWGRPVTGMTLKAEVLRPHGDGWETTSLALSESGPGLYRAELPARPTPPCLLRVTDATGRTHAVRSLALTAPRPMTNEERLGRAGELARAGGGRVNPGPSDIFQSDATPTVRRASIRPVMLLTALVFLLLDIIVRRYAAIVRLFVRRQ